jgi:hypothetical protein
MAGLWIGNRASFVSPTFIILSILAYYPYYRDDIMLTEQALRKHPSDAGKIKLIEKRQRLQSRLKKFNETAAGFWVHDEASDVPFQSQAIQDVDEEDDIGESLLKEGFLAGSKSLGHDMQGDEQCGDDELEDEDVPFADSVRLWMPSALGLDRCTRRGLTKLMEQEIQLREGQANDALGSIRLSLADVASFMRARHGDVKSQKNTTRSFAQLNAARGTLGRHARTYRRAYQALLNLDADTDQFKELTVKDMKVSADVVEENRIGQKSDTLSWIWRIGGGKNEQGGNVMEECKHGFAYAFTVPDTNFYSLSSELAEGQGSICKVV